MWELLSRDGVWLKLPQAIADWDYATELTFRRIMEVDDGAIREECQLPASAPLGISVLWHASGTNRRGVFPMVTVDARHTTVLASLEGDELGGQLHLRTMVLLAGDVTYGGPLTPHRCGSILWSEDTSVSLEGEAALFPIEEIDFAATGIAPAPAAWYLEWNPGEPQSATLGSVRLFINSGHEIVRRAAVHPTADAASKAITSAMFYDVLRQLIEGALDSADFDDTTNYPVGTLGASMRAALRLAFRESSLDVVRALKRTSRSDFEVRIQAAACLFST
jgi:hypothetical protein